MRRSGKNAAAAAMAAMPLRASLRPLLFLLVSLFLVLPMLVYNVVTLDFSQWSDSVSSGALLANRDYQGDGQFNGDETTALANLPAALQDCAAATLRGDLASAHAIEALRQRCFTQDTLASTTQSRGSDLVHFVYLPVQMVPLLEGESRPQTENFTMLQFAAVQSIRKHLSPTIMVLHYPGTEPRSFWYTQCQRHLSLYRVLFPKMPTVRRSSLDVYQRRDLMQFLLALRALRKQGGVAFVDFNTIMLRPAMPLWRVPLMFGRTRSSAAFSVAPTMLSAAPGNPYITELEIQLKLMLEADDERLRDRPLGQLVGELLVERYALTAGKVDQAKPNAVFTSPRVFDAVAPSQLNAFLSATREDGASTDLRDAIALRLPAAATASQSHAALHRVESRMTDFESLLADRTLFGAVLRNAISLNQTAELDDVLLR